VRGACSRETAVDALIALYESVLEEAARTPAPDADAEGRAFAAYLRGIAPDVKRGNGRRSARPGVLRRLWAGGSGAR
jgi:hypothetical protein